MTTRRPLTGLRRAALAVILLAPIPAPAALELTPRVVTDWGQGAQCVIQVKNTGPAVPPAWGVAVEMTRTIQSLWGGRIARQVPGAYLLVPEAWNKELQPGATTEIGMIVSPGGLERDAWRVQLVSTDTPAAPAATATPAATPEAPTPAPPTPAPVSPTAPPTAPAVPAPPAPTPPPTAEISPAPAPSPARAATAASTPATPATPAMTPTPAPTPGPTESPATPYPAPTPLTWTDGPVWPVTPTSENARFFGTPTASPPTASPAEADR